MLKLKAVVVALALLPALLLAFSSGPPPGATGGFGEPDCTDCHSGNPLNAAGGTFTISGVPASYTPGDPAVSITVTISKAGQSRWGFELAARSRNTRVQAGSFTSTATTRIQPASNLQYISQNGAGTQPGAPSGTWTFNWTPPATDIGEVVFTAAGNAANGNGSTTGDFIYTTQVSSSVRAQLNSPLPTKPVLTFIPQFVAGGNFVTRVFVNSLSASSNGVVINTINQNGQLANSATEQVLAPGAGLQTTTGEASRTSALSVQWVAIGSDGPISASVLFDCCAAGTSVTSAVGVLAQAPALTFKAPFVFQQQTATLPVLTEGLAIANRSDQANTITLTLLNSTGGNVASDTLQLQPFNQTAFGPDSSSSTPNIRTFLSNQSTFFGTLVLTGTQQLAPLYVGNLGGRLFSLPLTAQ